MIPLDAMGIRCRGSGAVAWATAPFSWPQTASSPVRTPGLPRSDPAGPCHRRRGPSAGSPGRSHLPGTAGAEAPAIPAHETAHDGPRRLPVSSSPAGAPIAGSSVARSESAARPQGRTAPADGLTLRQDSAHGVAALPPRMSSDGHSHGTHAAGAGRHRPVAVSLVPTSCRCGSSGRSEGCGGSWVVTFNRSINRRSEKGYRLTLGLL